MNKIRIKRFTEYEKEYGYEGLHAHCYQRLQVKTFWGWKTTDQEEVPAFVSIYLGAYGDTGGWKSKFADTHPHLFLSSK